MTSAASRYRTVLVDLDHTLFDTTASEDAAFAATMAAVGVVDPASLRPVYDLINRDLWAAVERHELTPLDVRDQRFVHFVEATGIRADPAGLATLFVDWLGRAGELYPGALDTITAVAAVADVVLVTNGLSEVQRPRLDRLGLTAHLDAVVISAEVGVSKPAQRIFDLALEAVGGRREEALMVGDGLTSDIRGATDYGMASCWLNANRVARALVDPSLRIDFEITDIRQLLGVCGIVAPGESAQAH